MPRHSAALGVLAGVLGLLRGGAADPLPEFSFQPPFNDVMPDGKRSIGKDWIVSGTTAVNQNFIRLTPDRQSKKGAVWSAAPIGRDSFTATLKFRIHGQGKKFFGDGLALWVMQQPYWVEGELHGVTPSFKGVGVVFDTFKNTEQGARHKDVAVFVNDGTKTQPVMMQEFEGCDASVRYHGERADFDVTNSSKAKITIERNIFTVMIDARANGNWFTCHRLELPLEEDWATKAHLGITASTGQLADNHDVLALWSFGDLGLHPEADDLLVTPKFERGANMTVEERLDRIEYMIASVLDMIEHLQAHNEHQLVAVQDHITTTIRKMQQQEDNLDYRVLKLEEDVTKSLTGTIDERVKHLDHTLERTMAHRVAALETDLHSRVQSVMRQGAGGWKLYAFLFAALGVCMAVIYRWYRRLLKSHIL